MAAVFRALRVCVLYRRTHGGPWQLNDLLQTHPLVPAPGGAQEWAERVHLDQSPASV